MRGNGTVEVRKVFISVKTENGEWLGGMLIRPAKFVCRSMYLFRKAFESIGMMVNDYRQSDCTLFVNAVHKFGHDGEKIVVTMNTYDGGTYYFAPDTFFITYTTGSFELDDASKRLLESMGVHVYNDYTMELDNGKRVRYVNLILNKNKGIPDTRGVEEIDVERMANS